MTRRILGLAGPPGAGKSTLASLLVDASDEPAALVPMDGFHLADVTLDRLGLRDRKGAPETFDAWGYAALLGRLRARPPETVYAPGFARDLEQPLAGAVAVDPSAELVVTEGNYLLLDRPEWRAVRVALDEVWFVTVEDAVRRERLVARHVASGKSPEAARAWVQRVDEANAVLVAGTRRRADRVLDLTGWDGVSLPG
ncbi:MAG: nucleoside/nucleotide kinase family protein [Nocardioidaceae bacterium]